MLQADEAALLFLIYWWRNEAWGDTADTELMLHEFWSQGPTANMTAEVF